MSFRSLWLWLCVAAGLFAFIFFYQRHVHKGPIAPPRILPNMQASTVTSVQVRPESKLEIRSERTNDIWQLTEPLRYPAQGGSIETLLGILERLTPAAYITRQELRARPKALEEYGLSSPQASVIIQQGDYRMHLFVGARTAPGNQVFLQVVGDDGIYIVDAELLDFIPRNANAWRDTALLDAGIGAVDRISVTNAGKSFEFQRDPGGGHWKMLLPGFQARADEQKIEQLLRNARDIRVRQFISDELKQDLDQFGLQAPEMQLVFHRGTNQVAALQFSSRGPTNGPSQVFARRPGANTVTVETNTLTPWHAQPNDFRDPHLMTLTEPVAVIEVKGRDEFSLVQGTNEAWQNIPQNFTADPGLVGELLTTLSGMAIAQYVKDVVPEPDLQAYGLATPTVQYTLKGAPQNGNGSSNVIAAVSFGTNQNGKVYVRRADEPSVYAVRQSDVQSLGTASWQFRERQVWNIGVSNLAGITIQQRGLVRECIRKAQYEWSLAPGSQGVIEPLSTEETVRGVCHLKVAAWVGRGETNRAAFGFTNQSPHQLTLDLRNGEKQKIEFGGPSPSSFPYGSVMLDGEPWFFEFPLMLCRDVLTYLSIPPQP